MSDPDDPVAPADVPLERDVFLRTLIRGLAGALGCHVAVYLQPTEEARGLFGREYFGP